MSSRMRKMIGIPAILLILLAWVVVAVTVGGYLPQHWAVQIAYYAVAGLGWGLPVIPLMTWMNRGAPDPDA